ncbi:MAG: GNAT family N-acetyltransferase [Bacteroidota bacterium]
MDIRILDNDEILQLKELIYLSLFVEPGHDPFPRSIVDVPEISKYWENWGRKGDVCLLAEIDSEPIGGVWLRLFPKKAAGYGFVDEDTPELGIALREGFRGKGIGSSLLDHIDQEALKNGFGQISLSVSKNNPAVRLYKRKGYQTWKEEETAYTMLKVLGY